jgi:hypothetical protein
MAEDVQNAPPIPLGEIIAERCFTLFKRSGMAHQVVVQIGKPVPADLLGNPVPADSVGKHESFRCPFCITGLDICNRIFAPFGEDSLVALQYSIGLAGQILDEAVQRLDLLNPFQEVRERHHPDQKHFDATGYPDWLWRYDSQFNTDYDLQKDC